MAVTHAVCWMPYFTAMLIYSIAPLVPIADTNSVDKVAELFAIIRFLTSLINPLLYIFFKRDFREALRMLCGAKGIRTDFYRDFYRNSINCNLDNPKNLWKIIRNLAPSQCSNLPSHLLVDGIIYDSHIDIANLFNAHFANIASSVVLNKNASTTPNLGYLKDVVRSKLPLGVSFTIPPITSFCVCS